MNNDDLKILNIVEITTKLQDFPGWIYKDGKISKEFKFATFMDGIKLIDELAIFCDKIDHHPDISIRYTKIKFDLQRFSVGQKVTLRDFTVAKKIEDLYLALKK